MGVATGSDPEAPRPEINSGRSDVQNGGGAGARMVTLFSTRLIPYLSRTTSKNEGLRPESTRNGNTRLGGPFRPPPQVRESSRGTLSRWRHGFEPRWDYEHKGPGLGTSMKAFGRVNRDSNGLLVFLEARRRAMSNWHDSS